MEKRELTKTLKDSEIVAAYCDASSAALEYGYKVIICGQMLAEKRTQLRCSSHSGTSTLRTPCQKMVSHVSRGNQHTGATGFDEWLDSVNICRTTAYRWMENAERVMCKLFGTDIGQSYDDVIDIGGEAVPLSAVLLAAPGKYSGRAGELRQSLFDFMENKTLREALVACADGESPAHRISRASQGDAGGRGDRKNYPLFVARNLKAFSVNIRSWDAWQAEKPAQHAAVAGILRSFVMGGQIPSGPRHKIDVQAWPVSLCKLLSDLCRERLKKAATPD